jgi:hypothetical protein
LQKEHPRWSDEQLYQEARKLNIATEEIITYTEFLPALLGPNALPAYTGYRPNVDPAIATEFSTVAFRFGHSLLSGTVGRDTNDGLGIADVNPNGSGVDLAEDFFDPNLISATPGTDPFTGHTTSGIGAILKADADANANENDLLTIRQIRNLLLADGNVVNQDLIARDIQRTRDHGIGTYNDVRAAYGLPRVTSFAQITGDVTIQQKLEQTYGSVDQIDPFEGILAEDHVPGADVGPTLKAALVDQFVRLRDGDRFFYLNEHFTSDELNILRPANTLTKVIEANTEITNLQSDVFFFKASIGGTVFLDLGNGGVGTPGGLGLSRFTVNLNDDGGHVIATTTTDSDGRYSFTDQTGLPGTGQFTVSLVLPSGLRLTTQDPGTILIRRGDIDTTVNFGVGFTLDTRPHIVSTGVNAVHLSTTKPGPNQFNADELGGSDSGLFRNDRITRVIQPFIDGMVDQQADPVVVQLLENGRVIGQGVTDASGNFSIQVNAGVYKADGSTDGMHTLTVVAPHGNTPSNTVTLTFTLKTTRPATPPAPNLTLDSDTGFSNTDHITAINTPTFTGTAEARTQVQLFANGQLVGTAFVVTANGDDPVGTYTVTATTPLADGTHDITVRLEDLAGNFSDVSAPMRPPLVILTTKPSKPTLRLDPASEISPGTNVSAFIPQIFDSTADPGTRVVIKDNGIVIDSFMQDPGKNTFQRTLSLTDGFHALAVESTGSAGATAVSDVLNITVNRDALDPDHEFIRQFYFAALGRTGNLAEWNLWLPTLAGANGRALVARAIGASREARDFLIKGYYRTFLSREAGGGEENAWVNAMLAGATEEQVISGILGSPEYFNHAASIPGIGGTASNDTHIRAVYRQLLNRDAGQADLDIWDRLIPTVGRQAMALGVLLSPEYRSLVVRSYYLNLLRRPTVRAQSEVNLWVLSGLDLTGIRVGFESSQEYYFRVTGFNP